jgi:hypothetical protein
MLTISSAAFAATTRATISPNSPVLALQIDYGPGEFEMDGTAAASVQALADQMAARIAAGEKLGMTLQAAADNQPYSGGNGNLAALRLGGVATVFEAALRAHLGQGAAPGAEIDTSPWLCQQLLTGQPKGQRFVRVWLYEGGFATVQVATPELPDSLVTERELEQRLASFSGFRELLEKALRSDDNVALRASAGVLYDDMVDAAGPEFGVRVLLFLDGEQPYYISAGGSVAALDGDACWRFGGGLGWNPGRFDLALQYRRVLYAPEQYRDSTGGITQSYRAHAHTGGVRAGWQFSDHFMLQGEVYGGSGYRLVGRSVYKHKNTGVAAGLGLAF